MKRYQIRRWDKRNTLLFRKYAYPLWFMMGVSAVGMIYSMTL